MKKLLVISISIFIFTACTDHEQKGAELFDSRDYSGALYHFSEVLSLDPRNEMMLYNAARCYEEMSKYDKAIEKYDKSIANRKDLVIAYLGRGRSYFKKGEFKSAVLDFGNALYYGKENEDALYYGALSLMKDSVYDKSRQAFTDLLELNPNHFKARYNRGVLYATQANTLFALSDFNNLIRNKKLLKNTYYSRGMVYQHINNNGGAIHDYTKAIQMGFRNENILIQRAQCYLNIQENEKACLDYRELLKVNHKLGVQYLKEYCDSEYL